MNNKIAKSCLLTCLSIFLQVNSLAKPAAKTTTATKATAKKVEANQRWQEKQIARGKALFAAHQCLDCHKIAGKGCAEGVELDGIANLRSDTFMKAHLEDPEKTSEVLGEPNMMTAQNLDKEEIAALVAYLRTLKKQSK